MEDASEKSTGIGFRVERLFTVGILIVPGAAILSASVYFLFLSGMVSIIPLSFFNLQDHFDKAVDLLIPVFIAVGVQHFGTGLLAGAFTPSTTKEPKEKGVASVLADWIVPIFLLALGTVDLLARPEEDRFFGALFISLGLLMFGVRVFPEKIRMVLSIAKIGWMTLWGTLTLCAFLFCFTMQNAISSVAAAKRAHFESGKAVLIDNFTFGHLVLEDQRFKVKSPEGDVLIESPTLPKESKSMACSWGWSWACQFNRNYGKPPIADELRKS